MASSSNSAFFQTHLDNLANDIREVSDKLNIPTANAAERVIAARLGYDVDEIEFVDGAGDRGIDFWYGSEGGLYIYQVKTHNLTENGRIEYQRKFNNDGVNDLNRVMHFLKSDDRLEDSRRLGKVKDTFLRLVRNHSSQEIETPLHIYLSLIILGEELTSGAFTELADLEKSAEKPFLFEDIHIQFHIALQDIYDILASEWRQSNDEWKDRNGNKRNHIKLTPLRQSEKRDYLNDTKSAIFYCSAFDLIQAYDDFGYQIFAPNVRANIKNSGVNSAIQESASYVRTMKEFRFLNNGLTIICASYKLPAGQRASFEITEPGVVNGLQTVVALHKAYNSLQKSLQAEFQENCYVLVRLLRTDAVNQISEVVLSTNNQNPMQPRNLVSNSSEQTHYFLFFANKLGWFYEAKQGAWEAFKKDERGWRPRINKSANAFRAKSIKKIDNLDLAQDWLAFLGFADRAANDKKHLFDQDKGYYRLVFLSRLKNHGYNHYQSLDEAYADCEGDTPDPYTMLSAHLAREFANQVVPTAQANKKEALQRHGISDPNQISTAEEARILSEDPEYSLNQALGTMSLVFVEFVGYSLFRVLGQDTHRVGSILLENHSWKALASHYDWRYGVERATGENKDLAENDLLVIMWLFFREAVQTLLGGVWQTPYRNTRYKPRFVLNNRGQLYQEILTMDQSIQRRVPLRIWAYGVRDGEGFFGYLSRNLKT